MNRLEGLSASPLALASLLLVLALGVSACGGGGGGNGGAGEATAPQEPPTDNPPVDEPEGGERFTATEFRPPLSFDVPQGWQAFEVDGNLVQVFEGANQDRGVSFDGSFREMSVDEAVTQLRGSEGFETGETSPTEVGGASGQMFEGTVQQETTFEGSAYIPFPGVRIQVHVVDAGGRTVAVFVDAPEDIAEEFFPTVRPVLDSVEFGGGG